MPPASTTAGTPCSVSGNRLVRASPHGPAARPPGRTRGGRWITIPPPVPGRGRRRVDLYAAAEWITAKAPLKLEKGAQDCSDRYAESYSQVLQAKYSRANFEEAAQRMKLVEDTTQLECLLASSHNARVIAEIEQLQARRDAISNALQRLELERAQITERSNSIAASEPREESGGRKALRAFGLVLQGMGQGLSGPSAQRSAPRAEQGGCSSDYQCQYGWACVKAPYASLGNCAQKVNEYRTPTLTPPSPTSVYPGGNGQCGFDTECPVGFYCAKEPGALRGACLAR